MKEKEIVFLSVDLKEKDKLHEDYRDKLRYLFKNPEFCKQVMEVRDKFKIPAYGIKEPLGVTDAVLPEMKKRKREIFLNEMSITYDDTTLKKIGIKKKSRQKNFQEEITEIRKNFNLPNRFQEPLAFYVKYGRLLKLSTHSPRCLIRVFEDKGGNRLFLEIYGDTTKQDVIKAWELIKSVKKRYKIPGGHLFRNINYYRSKMKVEELKPEYTKDEENKRDNLKPHEKFYQDYDKDNVDKHRFRKQLSKNYSK